jgi:hypothetical protein
VRPRGEDERLVAPQRDEDLSLLELLALVGAPFDRRLDLSPRAERDPQQVRRRARSGVVVDGDDAADGELRKLLLLAHSHLDPRRRGGETARLCLRAAAHGQQKAIGG